MTINCYSKLKKTYSLPDEKELVERLEIEVKKDQDAALLIQNIRNDVLDKLYGLMKTVESILFTNEGSDAGLLYQEHMVSDVLKEGFNLYKKLNELYYSGMKLNFKHDRKKDSEFINEIFNLWPELEKGLILFFEALENGWKVMDINKEMKPENYHG